MPNTVETRSTLAGANQSSLSPLAGKPALKEMLVNVARLESSYFERRPDLQDPNQLISFGTSGHRGSPFQSTFTEAHILAITQAICDHRQSRGTDGPLYMGKDTHALSSLALRTALEVLAANSVETVIHQNDGVTPTPVISEDIYKIYAESFKSEQHLNSIVAEAEKMVNNALRSSAGGRQ